MYVDELVDLALRAIDEGLRSVLGESVTKTLYYHFEERSGLRMEDVFKRPEGPELFTRFLRDFFDHGYGILERAVLEALNKRVGVRASSLSEALSWLSSLSTPSTPCSTCLR